MSKTYSLDEIGKCRVCEKPAAQLVRRNVGGIKALIPYCDLHAEIAMKYFGLSESRKVMGGFISA